MSRALALIDGEHYPPVVRFALAELAREHDVVAAVFVGGTEKIDAADGERSYGVPLVASGSATRSLDEALERYAPDVVVDLSDEPVLSSSARFRLASIALQHGTAYRGADFAFEPPRDRVSIGTPTLAIVGTGKRVGKTAVSAFAARRLKAEGLDLAVLAMGRGGPEQPEVIRGDEVELATADLLALARQGVHAASDNYEDAVMSRVTTVGCRRCGGGMAGETFFSNVVEGARLADALGKKLVVLEGSGAAVPPVHADATLLVVGAGRGEGYVRDFFGPYRVAQADLVVITGAEKPVATPAEVEAIRSAIERERPGVPVVESVFRPAPLERVAGRRVFFASTAPPELVPELAAYLDAEYGCEVVGTSANLSNRRLLRDEIASSVGDFDVLLTELKAAAIDVVAETGDELGVPVVLCDNVPLAIDGADLGGFVSELAARAQKRGRERRAP